MPLAAAVIGAAVIGGGASLIASGNASKQARDAATQNNATATNVYNQNKENMAPYAQRGNAAGNQINALLGLGGGQVSAPAPANDGYGGEYGGYDAPGFDGGNNFNGGSRMFSPRSTMPAAANDPAAAARGAFDTYRNSDGYQFRFNQGADAINNNYAARGLLQSGAALKELTNYGQGQASNEFGKYLSQLSGQQGVGLGAVNGLAGVGGNYVNQTSANNDSAASASGNAGLAAAGQVNNILGTGLSAYGYSRGSSYGGGFNPGAATAGASGAFSPNGYVNGLSAPKGF